MRVAYCLALLLLASLPLASVRAQSPTAHRPGAAVATKVADLPPPYITRQVEIEVPFSVKTVGEATPVAVRIYVSWDGGANWHLYQEKRPEEGKFRFRAKQDGEFWFATQTIDSVNRAPRETPKAPQLRLVVDTQKPQLQCRAMPTQDGKIALSWTAIDPHLNAQSLKIEYQDASGSGPWETVVASPTGPTAPGQSVGNLQIQPASPSGSVNVRAEIADVAGNVAYFSERVTLPRPTAAPAPGAMPLAAADSSATPWPDDGPSRASEPQPSSLANSDPETEGLVTNPHLPSPSTPRVPNYQPVASSLQPSVAGPPSFDALPPPADRATSGDSAPTADNANAPPGEQPTDPFDRGSSGRSFPEFNAPANRPNGGIQASPANSSIEPYRPFQGPRDLAGPGNFAPGNAPDVAPLPAPNVADEEVQPSPFNSRNNSRDSASEMLPAPNSTQRPSPEPIGPQRPGGSGDLAEEFIPGKPRMTNTRRFSLEYDVETVGPEGLADVELWGTTDDGQTWSKWGSDPDKISPFDVEVNGEGLYGFRVVIVGRNGLASNTPQPGDAADIWVGVDQTKPTARITAAAYGAGAQAGKLDIRWEASDENLASRPITLSMSDRPEGPYTPIAAGLPNTGQYYWQFDPRSPRQIFLRLEVHDQAGNYAVDQLVEPIHVEGLAPKGRIRGFAPVPETSQPPFRSPLFR